MVAGVRRSLERVVICVKRGIEIKQDKRNRMLTMGSF